MTKPERSALARSLPDIPRWLYARSMLLANRCEVLGLKETEAGPSFVARELEERENQWFCVVGRPPAESIEEAARRNGGGEAVAAPEDAPHILGSLPGWTAARVTLHMLGDAPMLPRLAAGEVEPFGASDLDAAADDFPRICVPTSRAR